MGLDITAYEHIQFIKSKPTGGYPDADYDRPETEPLFYNYECFTPRSDGNPEGLYLISGDTYRFPAGSYSWYGQWRDQLADMVEYHCELDEDASGPFDEIINFADNEGTIGPATSAKLAKDFADWQQRADEFKCEDAEWFRRLYADFRKAFELAANTGAVKFH